MNMKTGLIRCLQTEDMCPASTCLLVMENRKQAFETVSEEIELVGVVTCGGCPGKKAVTRAVEMIRRGADTIVLASCITRGTPIGFPCPHAQEIEAAIRKKAGDSIRIIEYTH